MFWKPHKTAQGVAQSYIISTMWMPEVACGCAGLSNAFSSPTRSGHLRQIVNVYYSLVAGKYQSNKEKSSIKFQVSFTTLQMYLT